MRPSRVYGAAIDGVAAGHAHCGGVRIRAVLEAQRVVFVRQVEGVEDIRPGRNHVHRVVHDQGLTLVPTKHAGGERPHGAQRADIAGVDFVEGAVASGGQILSGQLPLAVVRGARRAGEKREAERCRAVDECCDCLRRTHRMPCSEFEWAELTTGASGRATAAEIQASSAPGFHLLHPVLSESGEFGRGRTDLPLTKAATDSTPRPGAHDRPISHAIAAKHRQVASCPAPAPRALAI